MEDGAFRAVTTTENAWKRTLILGAAVLAALGCAGIYHVRSGARSANARAGTTANRLRIGYQKGGALDVLRLDGDLDRRLAREDVTVQWLEFPAGPQLLEAIGVGSVDLGWTGDAPAIFALAAGNDLAYVANAPPDEAGRNRAILVAKDSPLRRVSDLRGRRIAVQKGSGTHSFLVQALERAGMSYRDVHPVYLAPADALAAFESGSVDAWAIWDPYLAIAQKKTGARVLVNGSGIVSAGSFYLASKTFARERPHWLRVALEEVERSARWAADHPRQAAELLAPHVGLDVNVLEEVERRAARPGQSRLETRSIDESEMRAQQKVADIFLRIGLLPDRVDVRTALLTKREYAAFSPLVR